MTFIPGKKGRASLSLAALGALFAGTVNGLLGTGAGTVFFLVAQRIYRDDPEIGAEDCFACAMAAVFPVSLLSLLTYPQSAAGEDILLSLLIPVSLGGLLGAFLSEKIGRGALKKIFAAVVIFGGAYMIAGR